jgi:hypothetical protein
MWHFFLKLDVREKLVVVKVAIGHAVRHQLMTPQQQQESKQQQWCWKTAKQETPAGEGTTSTAKTPAMKVSRNEARIMAVNVAMIKKIWWP